MQTNSAKLLQQGMELKKQENLTEAFEAFVSCIEQCCKDVRVDPGYGHLQISKKSLDQLFSILDTLAKNTEGTTDSVQDKIALYMVQIPKSPLIEKQELQKQIYEKSRLFYKQPTLDLKMARVYLQDMQVAQLELDRIESVLVSVSKKTILDWNTTLIATQIALISNSLFQKTNASEWFVSGVDQLSNSTIIFLGFQEYLYVGFQSLLQKLNCMDKLVDVSSCLLYTNHDVASCCTLLSLVSSSSLSPIQLQKYTQLKTMFDTHSLAIHLEILQDMKSHHPLDPIVPCVQVFVEWSVKELLSNTSGLHGAMMTLEQCYGLIEKKGVDDGCLHWILSLDFDPLWTRDFWKQVKNAVGNFSLEKELIMNTVEDELCSRVEGTKENVKDDQVKDQETAAESSNEPNEETDDDLMKRFQNLLNKK